MQRQVLLRRSHLATDRYVFSVLSLFSEFLLAKTSNSCVRIYIYFTFPAAKQRLTLPASAPCHVRFIEACGHLIWNFYLNLSLIVEQ
jgi:hypothetical protein